MINHAYPVDAQRPNRPLTLYDERSAKQGETDADHQADTEDGEQPAALALRDRSGERDAAVLLVAERERGFVSIRNDGGICRPRETTPGMHDSAFPGRCSRSVDALCEPVGRQIRPPFPEPSRLAGRCKVGSDLPPSLGVRGSQPDRHVINIPRTKKRLSKLRAEARYAATAAEKAQKALDQAEGWYEHATYELGAEEVAAIDRVRQDRGVDFAKAKRMLGIQ